ncbi:MAG: adenylate/guanylate cyclase domain-containing protein [Pseudomonadota bacterium]
MRVLRGVELDLENQGERRNLTVLFSDLVGSTQISSNLDPEQWHWIVTKYQQAAVEVIAEFGGHVGKFLGDGIMAYFGYPNAQEDSAERAANAGLKIVSAVEALTDLGEKAINLEARVGIHAGPVVMAPLADIGAEIFGDVPNISARVQSVAAPNSVVMTKQIHQAVAGKFRVESLGARPLDGIDEPLELFRVHGALMLNDADRAHFGGDPSPMIGREPEMAAIENKCRMAREGAPQFVLITGEAGIGKSRLLEEIRTIQSQLSCRWIACAGRQLYRGTAFHGAAEILFRGLDLKLEDRTAVNASELEDILQSIEIDNEFLADTVSGLAAIMDMALATKQAAPVLAPEKMRDQMFRAMKSWVRQISQHEFVVLVFEDLHWIDYSTLELINQLVEEEAGKHLLILATTRSEFRATWQRREHHLQVELDRLQTAQTHELISGLIEHHDVSADLLNNLVDRAGGVPLFAEALIHLLSNSDSLLELDIIPDTLHASLSARVDKTGDAKLIAQLASVIGREFDYEVLLLISDLSDPELRSLINQLVDADFIRPGEEGSETAYIFTHALLRDAAYSSLLKRQQKVLHRRVAETLRDGFEEFSVSRPQLLARHWTAAEEYGHAWVAWKQTARHALTSFAYREAADAYEQAIDNIAKCPPDLRLDDEVSLWQSYVNALQISRGYSAPRTQEAMRQARKLVDQTNDPERQFTHTAGEWMAASSAADYLVAEKLANRLSTLAEQTRSPDKLATAKMILMTSRYRIGNLRGADKTFRSGIKYFRNESYMQRPGAVAQLYGNAAINAWIMGEVEEAQKRIRPVVDLAETSTHKYERAFSSHMVSMFFFLLEDFFEAKRFAQQSIDFAERGGFPQFIWNSTIILGSAQAKGGDIDSGLACLEKGIVGYESTKSRAGLTTYLTWFAATQRLAGSFEAALMTLNRALSINPDERYFRPESLRLRGALLLQLGHVERAKNDLLAAIDLAQTMGAKHFEAAIAAEFRQLSEVGNRNA